MLPTSAGRPYLAIVAIARDESDCIDEWIAFHETVGVEHFYIYDNGSVDGTADLVRERENVTVFDWPGERQQLPAYANALVRCPAQWLAFIDLDEFLFSPAYLPVPALLRSHYGDADAVGVCWAMFGTSHILTQPEGGVLASYTLRATDDDIVHRHIKSIVQPSRVRSHALYDPHQFDCETVDTLGRSLDGAFARTPTWKRLRINHYWSKSVEEAEQKARTPRADNGGIRSGLLSEQLNRVPDFTIQPYLPLVAARLRKT